jgi:hypothetical protein
MDHEHAARGRMKPGDVVVMHIPNAPEHPEIQLWLNTSYMRPSACTLLSDVPAVIVAVTCSFTRPNWAFIVTTNGCGWIETMLLRKLNA